MASQSDIARRWAEEVGKPSPRMLRARSSNVYVGDDDRIYSYGAHFELGRLVGNRASGFFLLNGDRYSVTTSGHQSRVRDAVAGTGIPSVIMPYSALHAAGIELDSIRPLDAKPERTDSWTEDVGPSWTLDDPRAFSTWNVSHESEYPFPTYMQGLPGYVARTWRLNYGPSANVHAVELLRGFAYPQAGYVNYRPGENVSYYDSHGNGVEVIDGRFHVTRYRHFLGACLFTARIAGRSGRRRFLSAFDENERRPLYFLCELPRCTARTYEEALDALAPRIVHAALAQGRDVVRQGDVFAIPTELTRSVLRKRGAIFRKRAPMLDTNHAATEVAFVRGAVYARGCLYHDVGSFRERDHARVKMGDGKAWHLIARNTVPRTRSTRRAGAARL